MFLQDISNQEKMDNRMFGELWENTSMDGPEEDIKEQGRMVGWLVVLGLTALWDSISVYIGPSPKEREKEERKDRWE